MEGIIKKYRRLRPGIRDLIAYGWIGFWKWQSGAWGTVLFRLKALFLGVECRGRVRCWGTVQLIRAPLSRIAFGRNISIISDTYRASASSLYAPTKIQTFNRTARIEIGDNVGMNGASIVARSCCIKIGSNTMLAPNVVVMDSDFHAAWPPENRNCPSDNDRDVTIGENVWLGLGVIVLKGVAIGNNSIVGAGSIVTRNIPANVVAAGNPAAIVKQLGPARSTAPNRRSSENEE